MCVLPYTIYVITVERFCPDCNDPVILYRLVFLQFCNACLDPLPYVLYTDSKLILFLPTEVGCTCKCDK